MPPLHHDPERATIFQRSTTTATAGLPPEWIARSRTRLARILGVFAVLSAIALLLGLFVFEPRIDLSGRIFHAINIVLAVVVAVASSARRVPARVALDLGLVYLVIFCWAVNFVTNVGMTAEIGRPPHVNWSSILIVVYPLLIPLPPTRLLVSSILAALGTPASLWWMERTGLYAADVSEYMGLSLSPAFAVVLGFVGARMIYAMSLDVSRARRMGAYQLEAPLGRGGMGEVWRAQHAMLARPAAVKLIAPDRLGSDPASAREMIRRFEAEARSTAALRSPHTVQVYDYGVTDDGSFYYVMELLDGFDLAELVERDGPQPAGRVVHLLRQACHSLGEAHAQGLIHRDVKPANIFTCRYGPDVDFVKVLDFGLVHRHARAADQTLTATNTVVGTPAFLAPEMATGSVLDGRADLYSLGCVGYWLLTGSLVFPSESPMELIAAHLHTPAERPSTRTEQTIPIDLEDVLMSCLEKDPAQRPASASAMAQRLDACAVAPWDSEDAETWWARCRPATGESSRPGSR